MVRWSWKLLWDIRTSRNHLKRCVWGIERERSQEFQEDAAASAKVLRQGSSWETGGRMVWLDVLCAFFWGGGQWEAICLKVRRWAWPDRPELMGQCRSLDFTLSTTGKGEGLALPLLLLTSQLKDFAPYFSVSFLLWHVHSKGTHLPLSTAIAALHSFVVCFCHSGLNIWYALLPCLLSSNSKHMLRKKVSFFPLW